MSQSSSSSLPLPGRETTSGDAEETRWEVVARTPGLMPATIIVGRLQAEGIPARAWQEGAGQALGLTVGLLGTGYVIVPEDYVDQALEILEDVEEEGEWDDDSYIMGEEGAEEETS